MLYRTTGSLTAVVVLCGVACGPSGQPSPRPLSPTGAPKTAPSSPAPTVVAPAQGPLKTIGKFSLFAFDLAHEPPPRTPVLAPPTPIPADDAKGSVEGGDEVKLAEVLLGTAAKAEPLDADIASVPEGVQLVIDSPYQIFSKTGSYVHVAAFGPTFAPASSARVFVDGTLRGKTDATGTFVFRDVWESSSPGSDSRNVAVVLGSGKDRKKGGANVRAFSRTQSFERANLYVYTDRGVFAPGDPVHVRAFAWRLRGDYRPFKRGSVDVFLRRDGKLVSGGRVQTDDFGIASLDLPLPGTLPEGPYELAVEHLGERATARVQVRRVTTPAFRITHTLPRFLTRDATSMPFAVSLATATGGNFGSGTIVVHARDPKGAGVATETRKVTGNGPHVFTLDAPVLKKLRDAFPDDQLASVIVEVVDAGTGRRDELRRDLRISRNAYRLVVETDRTEHVPGESISAVIRATDLEGAPVSGHEIEVSMVAPGVAQKTVVTSDPGGLAKTSFTMPNGVSVEIVATLVKTPSIRASAFVATSPPRAMHSVIASAIVAEKQKTPIEVRFPSQWVPVEAVVHADVVDSSGSVIHAFVLPVAKDGAAFVARGSFPAPSWGSMLLTLFALGREKGTTGTSSIGLLTDGVSLPVIASRAVQITLQAPATASPGASVKIDVACKGPGDARPIELGIGVTDDAFLALLDPLERTPSQVLYNPERKVLASTGSQILTWPVVQKTWGSPTYDIALPPFGFRSGGAPLASGVWKKPTPANVGTKGGPTGGAGGPDNDADGIADSVDKCPDEPETYNGYQDDDGCPDKGKVLISSNEIVVMPPSASATATGTATLKPAPALSPPPPPPPPPAPSAKPPVTPPVTISIRTDFSPTTAWIPSLFVDAKGAAHVDAPLGDAIGTRRITVVASDDRGALGVATKKIVVDRDISVRSDLPAALVMGDELEVSVAVTNHRATPVAGDVSLGGISVVGAGTKALTIPASGIATTTFVVRAASAGAVSYEVRFKSVTAGIDDREKRTLHVAPRGAPRESVLEGTLRAAKPVSFSVVRKPDDVHVEADLSIAFPSAIPLLEGLEALVEGPLFGLDPDASRLLAAIAIEGYLVRTKAKHATIARVHARLTHAAAELVMGQHPNGGFGWRWDAWAAQQGLAPATSAYVTTHALLALAKLRETNVSVPTHAIVAARSYLLRSLGSDDEVDVSNVAFWEGEGPAKRRAATMAAFRALAESERVQPAHALELAKIDRLRAKAIAIAHGGAGSEDPLTLASALMGLVVHARVTKDASPATNAAVSEGLERLLTAAKTGYWEPSWFHAYGGRAEATRAVIELLLTVSPGKYEVELHDSVEWLLATRGAWGAWHNAWGTAAAIEALALLDPTPPEKSNATVSILVDGKTVRTVTIDPADPLSSGASLRSVDLSPFLTVGTHELRWTYDGALTVPSSLVVRTWGPPKKTAGLKTLIERALSVTTASVGGKVVAKVTVTATEPELFVRVPLGAGLEPDAKALDALVGKTVAGWRHERSAGGGGDSLELALLDVKGTRSVELPLIARSKGTFVLPAAFAWVPMSPEEAYSADAKLTVK